MTVWRGDLSLPAEEQGIRVFGTPFGHREFVEAEVLRTSEEHATLLDRTEAVPDLQCAWLILLFCAGARANCLLRVVHPSWSEAFAVRHDAAVWKCLCGLLDIRGTEEMRDRASLSLSSGGLGLRSATRGRDCAFWASWADALPTIRKRHPAVVDQICVALQRGDVGLHLVKAAQCRERLNTSGFESEWGDVARGLQPGQILLDDPMPGVARQGWQRGVAQHMEERLRTNIVWPRLDPPGQALLRSQSGTMAGIPFCCFPISMATRFEPQEFRILLLRRLWCPLPLCSASCRCGHPLDPRGHHRAACQVAGVLGRRGFPIESAVARVCSRVTTNVRVQDLDIPPGAVPDKDGLPLFHGAQLAVDATMVSPVRRDSSPTMRHDRRCSHDSGQKAQRTNVPRTCPSSWAGQSWWRAKSGADGHGRPCHLCTL